MYLLNFVNFVRYLNLIRLDNIDYLDLLPSFVAASKTTRLYKPNDTHWNIAGNSFAAELISRHLKALAD